MRRSLKQMKPREKEDTLKVLFSSVEAIHNSQDFNRFLEELLTTSEKVMLGRRIWIARLLLSGYSQAEINQKLQLSPNTTSKVHKWLNEQLPGYEDALIKLKEESEERFEIEKVKSLRKTKCQEDPFTFSSLRKRYPAHFLLFNLASSLVSKKR